MSKTIPIGHGCRGLSHRYADIRVYHQGDARFDSITTFGCDRRAQVAVTQGTGVFTGNVRLFLQQDLLRLSGGTQVVKQGLNARETMNSHQFFVVQRAVGLTKLGVTLVGNVAQLVVVAHSFTLLLDTRPSAARRK